MTHHVPAAHQSDHRLELILENGRLAAADACAPVDRRTVGLLAEVAVQVARLLADADLTAEPPTVDRHRLEDVAALIDHLDRSVSGDR
jgi:hypothetical protein